MDPRDRPRRPRDGEGCTVCGERVPADRVRVLARRDDLAFVQADCRACGSTTLGFVLAAGPVSEPGAGTGASPVSGDDVLDMHAFLASWGGDLASLVDGPAGGSR